MYLWEMFNKILKEFKLHDEALISTLQIDAVSEGWFVILVNVGKAITSDHTKSAPLSTLTLIQLKNQISKILLTHGDHYHSPQP